MFRAALCVLSLSITICLFDCFIAVVESFRNKMLLHEMITKLVAPYTTNQKDKADNDT